MRGSLFLRFEKLAENLFAVDISDPVKILTRQPKEIAAANAAVKKAYLDAKLDRLQQKKEKLEKREKLSPKVDDNAGETASKSAPADS
jgi:hypothetical protein